MKTLTICLILIGFTFRMKGQTNHSPSSSEFLNHIYYFLPDSLTALEQNTARMESKTKALGYGAVKEAFTWMERSRT